MTLLFPKDSEKDSKDSKDSKVVWKRCHDGVKLAFTSNGVEVYGASRTAAEDNFDRAVKSFDLIISLETANFKLRKSKVVEGENLTSVGYKELTKEIVNVPEILMLHWQDFGIPDLKKEFWDRLGKIIKKKGLDRKRRRKGKGVYRVMIHCQGGHGRTGTAISILLNKIGGEKVDLIEKVRRDYCDHAVENSKQIGYVEKMTGTVSSVKGSKAGFSGNSNLRGVKGVLEMSDEEWDEYIIGRDFTYKGKDKRDSKPSYMLKGGEVSNEPRSLVDGVLMTKKEEMEYRKRNK